jgi:hypothetical protein
VLHVLVSHYAVGGGFFLAMETGYAYRNRDRDYLAYLRRHARFFILVTVVYGAITGVGIWWTVGLASPLSTGVLIRTFVFGWAVEYVAFLVEIVAAFVFFYGWAAWISLVLITGITAFMLNPGRWLEDQSFRVGFLNPQFLPQTIARTGGALLLSSMYVYLHASLFMKDSRLLDLIGSRSARPALLGAILITLGGIGWFHYLPESAKSILMGASVLNVFMGLLFALTAAVFVLLYLGPYRNPGWLTPGFAVALFLFSVAAFTTGEFVREAVRKPYIIYNVVFGNQIFPEEVAQLRKTGYLEGGVWTKAFVADRFPEVLVDGKIDGKRMLALPEESQLVLGETIFQYHCNDCHAAKEGYSAAGRLVQGRPKEMVKDLVRNLHLAHYFMPPWAGTDEEATLLTEYLTSIAPPRPTWMRPEYDESEGK